MKMNTVDLPGVGKRITFINRENQMMSVIIQHNGKRELYFFEDAADDEAIFSFIVNAEETKQIGAQLLGVLTPLESEKLEKIKMVRKQVVVEWIEINKKSYVYGLTIEDLRKIIPAGVSVIGIIRSEDFIVELDSNILIKDQDTIMVVGKKEPVLKFEALCIGKDI